MIKLLFNRKPELSEICCCCCQYGLCLPHLQGNGSQTPGNVLKPALLRQQQSLVLTQFLAVKENRDYKSFYHSHLNVQCFYQSISVLNTIFQAKAVTLPRYSKHLRNHQVCFNSPLLLLTSAVLGRPLPQSLEECCY